MADKHEDRRVSAEMIIIHRTDGSRNNISDTVGSNHANNEIINYAGKIGIQYRGNSSFNSSDKKPFGLKTWDENEKNKDVDILGLGSNSDWVLMAPFNDKSMIRDVLNFELIRGLPDYVPQGIFCEVILNGVYEGIYVMTARVRRGETRINLPKPGTSGNNLTGGYQLEIDRPDEDGYFQSNHYFPDLYGNPTDKKHTYQHKYPDNDDFNDGMLTQRNYIRNRVHEFENVTAGSNFKDKENGYRKYIDPISVADFIIGQEIGRNVDGYRLSTPFYKYRDNKDPRFKLSFWDFNLAMGNADYCEGWSTEGWQWNHNKFSSEAERIPFWFKRMLSDEDFRIELRERWAEHRLGNLSNESINHKIDSLVNLISEAEVRNNQAWRIWTRDFWPNYYRSRSFAGEINFLKTWLAKRIVWMDDQFSPYSKNLVANSSFDSDLNRNDGNNNATLSNWLTNTSDIGLSTTVKHNGIYALSFRRTGETWQTITELAEDKYTFKAWVRTVNSPTSEAIVRHHNTNGTEIKMQIAPSNEFYEIVINDIDVNTGICEIAFKTSISNPGNTRLYVDSVSFVRQFDKQYKYHPDKKIDFISSNLPIVVVELDNVLLPNMFSADMSIINRTNGDRNFLTDLDNPSNLTNSNIINYNGKASFTVNNVNNDKKTFNFITLNNNNYYYSNLLGLGEKYNWVLEPVTDDKSLMRNAIGTNLSKNYIDKTTESKHCELVINGIYQGVFILTCPITNANNLDLTTPETGSTGITGGYILEISSSKKDGITSVHKNRNLAGQEFENYTHYNFVFPSADDYNNGMTLQKNFITEKIREFENIFTRENYADPVNGYASVLDITSAVNYILTQELFRNVNAYRENVVIYKDKDNVDGRFKIINNGMLNNIGNDDSFDGWATEGWVWNQNRFDTINMLPFWVKKLISDENFMTQLKLKWSDYRQDVFSDENIINAIDSLQSLLDESQKRNYRVYNTFESQIIQTYYNSKSWSDELENLKEFLLKRVVWIDSQLLKQPENYIANSSFDSDYSKTKNGTDMYVSNWNNPNIGLSSDIKYDGKYAVKLGRNEKIWQPVTELTDNLYTLKVWVKTSGTVDASIIVRYHNDEEIVKHIEQNNEFYEIIINNINVVTGYCEIEFNVAQNSETNAYLYVDKVSFFQDWENNYPYQPEEHITIMSSNLPIVVIDAEKPILNNAGDANMTIINRTNGERNLLSDMENIENFTNPNIINYNGKIDIKIEDIDFDKKSFYLATKNNSQKNILNLGEKQEWILVSVNDDKSLIRNSITTTLSKNNFGFVSSGKHCELIINGVYQGIYVLSYRFEDNISELNLPPPNTDITGGYVLEIDKANTGFSSNHKNYDLIGQKYNNYTYYNYIYPSAENYSNGMEEQKNYITNKIHEFENVMDGENFDDTTSGYRKYMDITSIADYILTQELFRNVNAYRKNMIIYKYSDAINSKFMVLNNSLYNNIGNIDYYDGWATDGWVWNQNHFDTINMIPFWIKRILSDEAFMTELKKRWAQHRQGDYSNKNISQTVDSLAQLLNEPQVRNYSVWKTLNTQIEPNYYAGASWQEEILYLKNFLLNRAKWIDSQFLTNPPDNIVANSSFDSDVSRGISNEVLLSAWTLDGEGNLSNDAVSGEHSYYLGQNSSISQTITEIPPGKYSMRVWVKTSDNASTRLHLNYHDNTNIQYIFDIDNSSFYQEFVLNSINIKSNVCNIKLETGNNTNAFINIDDVILYYIAPFSSESFDYVENNYLAYPNPFNNKVSFEFMAKDDKSIIYIHSLSGTLIDYIEVNTDKDLKTNIYWTPTKNIPAGLYFYKIINGCEQINGKLIKE
jgi:hypothetical protein